MLELTVRLVASLAVVIGLLLLIAKVGSRRFTSRRDAPLRVVHTQSLSRSSSVAVVEVYGRVLVLGTTDTQVNVLTELDPEALEEYDNTEEPVEPEATPARPSGRSLRPKPVVADAPAPAAVRPVVLPPVAAREARPAPAPAIAPAPLTPAAALADLVADPVPPSLPAALPVPVTQPEPAFQQTVYAAAVLDAPAVTGGVHRRQPQPESQPESQPATSLADLLLQDFGSGRDSAGWSEPAAPAPALRESTDALPAEVTSQRRRARRAPRTESPLAGSVLSLDTWRQAMTVARGRA